MGQLPRFDAAVVATRSDVAAVKSDMAELRTELKWVNQRLDRLFLTLLTGMFGIMAALIGLVFILA